MADKQTKKLSRADYTVGWICALSIEMAASVGMLEEEHQELDAAQGDRNMYTLGEIGGHNIVIACLPSGNMGITPAATVAKDMLRSFPKIRFGLMVGIGGGAPAPRARPSEDIRLGDVVISIPQGELGGVVKYDRGKVVAGGEFKHTGLLNMPPSLLTNAVAKLRAIHEKKRNTITRNITVMINKALESEDANPDFADQYQFPGLAYDLSFDANYEHNESVEPIPDSQQDEKSLDEDEDEVPRPCRDCDKTRLVRRKPRKTTDPVIHYGTIASADQVMRHGATRERIRKQYSVLCFEMEAAGLMNDFPCLVIRGICDYSDTHKHKIWQRYAAATAAAYAKELLGVVLKEEIEKTEEVVKLLERDKQLQDHWRVLDWLSINTHMGRFIDSYNRWHQGTVQRFLNSEEYLNWSNENTQTLWCPGIAGGGKTVFASVIVNNLKVQKPKTEVGIAYLFCEYARLKSETILSLAAAILSQLADQCAEFPESVTALHNVHRANKMPLRFEEISSALIGVLQTFSQVYLIIDALDECSEQTRRELLSYLLEQQKRTKIKLLVTSRPTIDFQQEYGDCEILEIRADEQDVKIVLGSLIERLPKFIRTDEALRNRVKNDIAAAVDGMFVLVELFLDSLQGERSRGDLKKALTALMNSTDKVSTVYDRTLIRIGSQNNKDCELAHRTLSWIVESKRPLTRQELQHALAVKQGGLSFQEEDVFDNVEEIVALCAGLVVINQRSNTIQLMHHTTRKYFEDEKHHPDWLAGAHIMIASVCLTYVSFTVFGVGPCRDDEQLESRLSEYPFLRYAAQHWGDHARDDHDQTPEVEELALNFLKDDARVNSSNQVIDLPEQRYPGYSQRYTRDVNGLQTGASFGLTSIIQNLIENGADIRAKDAEGRTALHRGAEQGHSAVVSILLKHGADIDVINSKFGQTPLHLAALNGHNKVIQVLLGGGAHTTMKDDDGWMAIHIAAWTGKQEVVRLLLEKTDINETGRDRLTALHCAAAQGHESVASLLIDKEADTNAKDCWGWTPLHWASKKRHDVMNPRVLTIKDQPSKLLRQVVSQQKELQVLMQYQNMVIQDKLSTIKGKLANWHGKLAWLPPQIGLDVDGKYHDVLTTLSLASNMQSFRLTMLTTPGKEEEPPGPARLMFAIQDELTALRCLTECGHERVAHLLLENKAKIMDVCKAKLEFNFIEAGPTALHLAASSDHEIMVRMLLNKGADVHARCETNMLHGLTGELHTKLSSLHFAIVSGNESVVQLLIERGADIHSICLWGIQSRHLELTSLHLAVICGNMRMVQLLLSNKVDINARCQMSFDIEDVDLEQGAYIRADLTPLHLATLLGKFSIIQLLVENHADVQVKVQLSMGTMLLELAALHIAIIYNRKETVQLLLQYGADFKTTLWARHGNDAAAAGSVGVVQLLLNNKSDPADICQINNDAENIVTPLHLAAIFNHEEVMRLLIKHQANVYINCRIKLDPWLDLHLSALHLVAIGGNMDIVQLLLEEGSDAHMKGSLRCSKAHTELADLTVLHLAAMRGHQRGMEQLLEAKCDFDSKFQISVHPWLHTELSVLHVAALVNHDGIVTLLLDKGTDIHSKIQIHGAYDSYMEFTLLSLAGIWNDERMAEALLEHGADADSRCQISTPELNVSINPLHMAAVWRNERMMQLLLSTSPFNEQSSSFSEFSSNLYSRLERGSSGRSRMRSRAQEIINKRSIGNLNERTSKADPNAMFMLNVGNTLVELNALHMAVFAGSMQMTQLLCNNGADVNVLFEANSRNKHSEFTALHLAVLRKSQAMVQYLLQNRADIHAKFRVALGNIHAEFSTLHLVVLCKESPGIPALLLERKPDLEAQCHISINGNTRVELILLHLIALVGQDGIANLQTKGVDPHTRILAMIKGSINLELTVLELAKIFHNELLSLLLQDEDEQTWAKGKPHIHAKQMAYLFAAVLGFKKLTELSLMAMSDVNEAFTIGIAANLEVAFVIPVQANTDATLDIKVEAELCLIHIATALGLVEVVNLLFKKGANLGAKCKVKIGDATYVEFTALHLAALLKHNEIAFLLLRIGADVQATSQLNIKRTVQAGLIAPHLTTFFGQDEFLRLLKKDIDIEAEVQAQYTSLHLAAFLNNEDVAWSLLYHGADIDATCLVNVVAKTQGNSNTIVEVQLTALHIATGAENEMVLKLLLEKGAKVDLAVQVSGTVVVDIGAQIHRNIRAGGTALHMVARLGNERIAQMLIDSGVNVDMKSRDGQTALKLARIHGHDKVVQLILKRQAQIKKKEDQRRCHQKLHKMFSKAGATPRSIPTSQEEIGQDQGDESESPKEKKNLEENITPFLKRFVVQKAEERLNRMRRGLFSRFTPTNFVKSGINMSSAHNKEAEPQTQQTTIESLAID